MPKFYTRCCSGRPPYIFVSSLNTGAMHRHRLSRRSSAAALRESRSLSARIKVSLHILDRYRACSLLHRRCASATPLQSPMLRSISEGMSSGQQRLLNRTRIRYRAEGGIDRVRQRTMVSDSDKALLTVTGESPGQSLHAAARHTLFKFCCQCAAWSYNHGVMVNTL